jgi:hypothetical protein
MRLQPTRPDPGPLDAEVRARGPALGHRAVQGHDRPGRLRAPDPDPAEHDRRGRPRRLLAPHPLLDGALRHAGHRPRRPDRGGPAPLDRGRHAGQGMVGRRRDGLAALRLRAAEGCQGRRDDHLAHEHLGADRLERRHQDVRDQRLVEPPGDHLPDQPGGQRHRRHRVPPGHQQHRAGRRGQLHRLLGRLPAPGLDRVHEVADGRHGRRQGRRGPAVQRPRGHRAAARPEHLRRRPPDRPQPDPAAVGEQLQERERLLRDGPGHLGHGDDRDAAGGRGPARLGAIPAGPARLHGDRVAGRIWRPTATRPPRPRASRRMCRSWRSTPGASTRPSCPRTSRASPSTRAPPSRSTASRSPGRSTSRPTSTSGTPSGWRRWASSTSTPSRTPSTRARGT